MRCLLFCLLLTTNCIAQRQLTNFRSSDPVGSNPAGFVTFAGRGYFLATDAAHGRNLWTSDGTPEGSRFFYELEPNKPTSAEFIPFVTDDYLYIFSRSNLFRIDNQHTITRLSSLSLTQPARPERIGDRLFFDAFQYVDLTTGLIQTEDPTRPLPSTIYFQSYRSETARMMYSWQGALYRLQTAKGNGQTLSLPSSERAFDIRQLLEWGGNYYVLSTQWVLYAIENGTFRRLDTPLMNFQTYRYDAQTGVFAGLTTSGQTFETYRFDGVELKLIDRKETLLQNIQPLLIEETNAYVLTSYKSARNEPVQALLRLQLGLGKIDTLALPNTTLQQASEPITVQRMRRTGPWLNTTVRIGFGSRPTTRTWLLNTETGQFINTPYTDFCWLPDTRTGLVAKPLSSDITLPTTELYAFRNGQDQLLRDEPGVFPNLMSFGTNFNRDAAYLALNESRVGAALYRLNVANTDLQRVYQNPNERFYVDYGLSPTAGVYVTEDIGVITFGTEPQFTYLYEYMANRLRVLAEPSGAMVNLPPALSTISLPSGPSYLLRESGVFIQITPADAPVLVIPVRVGAGGPTFKINNKLFFMADDDRFPKHLMVFDPRKGLSRVFDQPVKEIRMFRDQLLVSTQDRLYLVETHGNHEVRYLTDLHWEQHFNVRSTPEFALITTENEVWYTDGTCQRTQKLHTGETSRWAELLDPLPNQREFLYRFDGTVYVFDGNTPRKFSTELKTLLGRTPTYFYWSNYGTNYASTDIGGDLVVYRTHLKTFKTETLMTVPRERFNPYTISMSTQRFLEIVEGKKWLFFWDRSVYEFSDTDDYRLAQNHPTPVYFTLLGRNNGRALLRRNFTLVAYENGMFRDLTAELTFASLSEGMSSQDYRYFLTSTPGSPKPDNLMRVSLNDFSVVQKKLPFAPQQIRTRNDIDRPYPLVALTTGLYGILETPGSGQQLWLLDEARQTFPTAQTVAYEAFSPVSWCTATSETVNQPVPTEFEAEAGVFPNPTNRYVYVNLFADYDPATVQLSVIGTDGRVLPTTGLVRSTALSKQVVELNLGDLPAGTYHVRVNAGGQVRVWKVLLL